MQQAIDMLRCFASYILLMGMLSCSTQGMFSEKNRADGEGRSGAVKASGVGEVTASSVTACDGVADEHRQSFPVEAKHNKLDVLVAIDSNVGTETSRNHVAAQMQKLLTDDHLSGSDYRVAIISGNIDTCVESVITKQTDNAVNELVLAIRNGITGEMGHYITMKAITGMTGRKSDVWHVEDGVGEVRKNIKISWPFTPVNAIEARDRHLATDMCDNSWLRDDSVAAIIVISGNKHLCCHPYACTMLDIENSLREAGRLSNADQHRRFRLYGLLNQKDTYENVQAYYDTTYTYKDKHPTSWYVDWRDFEEYNITGTTTPLVDFVKSIDDPDYTAVFDNIADDIWTSLVDTFTLAEKHDNDYASVTITSKNGETRTLDTDDYAITGNTLKIKQLTTSDNKVDVVYSFCAAP